MSAMITSDYFIIIHTSRTKGYVHKSVRPWSLNCSIVPVFWSLFEVSFQNISPFSNRIKPKLLETLSDATESNAQRNKLSLQATTSRGVSHFRKTHLKRREVVMLFLIPLLKLVQFLLQPFRPTSFDGLLQTLLPWRLHNKFFLSCTRQGHTWTNLFKFHALNSCSC